MYMGRAQSLRSPEVLGSANLSVAAAKPEGVDPQAQRLQSKLSSSVAGMETIKTPDLGSLRTAQDQSAGLRVSVDQGTERPSLAALEEGFFEESTLEQGPQSLAYVLAAQDWLRGMAGAAQGVSAGDVHGGLSVNQDGIRPELSSAIRQELGLPGNLLSPDKAPDAAVSGPTSHVASFDAWRTLGDTLKGLDTEAQVFDTDSQESPAVRPILGDVSAWSRTTGLQANRQPNSDMVLRAPWLVAQESLQHGAPGELSAARGTPGSGWSVIPASTSSLASGTGALGAKMPLNLDVKNKSPESSANLWDRSSDLFGASIQAALETAAKGNGEPSFGSGQQSDQGSDKGSAGSGVIDPLSIRPTSLERSAFDANMQAPIDGVAPQAAESAMTPSQRAHLVQQVIDRTTMLSSQGGGIVRLDLSSADLGRMEVAVAMDEGRVNLRVLTGSDGMRSAILTDMTRLKEALGQQNLQLGLVEVGVAGQQTSGGGQSFAGQGSFDQRREFSREDFARTMAQSIGSRGSSRAPAVEVNPQSSLAPAETLLGNGRISLRI
jgi:hypothetical protein